MSENWIELEATYFFPVGKRLPITLVRGEGTRVWDEDGASTWTSWPGSRS